VYNWQPDSSSADTFVDLLTRVAAEHPVRPAYVFLEDGEREGGRLSFAQLHRRAAALAAQPALREARGQRALVVTSAGLDFLVALFACFYAGVIAVPAPAPRSQGGRGANGRLQWLVRDADAQLLLTTSDLRESCLDAVGELVHALTWIEVDWTAADEAHADWTRPVLTGSDPAYLQYTSGSTRAPKGVIVTHDNVISNLAGIAGAFGTCETDVNVTWLPHFHDMGLVDGLLHTVFAANTTVFMSPQSFLKRPGRWLEAISRYRAVRSGGPNFAFNNCVHAHSAARDRDLDLSSWRIAYCGAEPIRRASLERFVETYAPHGFQRRALMPAYGLAEATLCVSMSSPDEDLHLAAPRSSLSEATMIGCGRPVLGVDVVIVDGAGARRCEDGEIGEICVAGRGVSPGYWNASADGSCFGAKLPGDPKPYLRTGDLGFMSAGQVVVSGRIKDLMIMEGRNVFAEDVEHTVSNASPELAQARIAAFSVDRLAEEQLVVVIGLPPSAISEGELKKLGRAVRGAVAEEHGVTARELVFVKRGLLPQTSSGKIQRGECKRMFLANALRPLEPTVAAATAD
jgi:acyl-CoA synthetase (AMP-forming)/AMP-acid ligase II